MAVFRTLGIKHYYNGRDTGGGSMPGAGRRQMNNINSGVMSHLGNWYKMDDREIRTYIGQPDPENDAHGAEATMFSTMRDQSHRHTGYSNNNREYTTMKKYTARWYVTSPIHFV